MFLDNKYNRWYFNIIRVAIQENRIKSKDKYFESHHIIPRSLGGTDSVDNLVLLKPKEHLLCHMLLMKMVSSEIHKKKMYHAFHLMTTNRFGKRISNSRLYDFYRSRWAKFMKGSNHHNFGREWTEETRKIKSKICKESSWYNNGIKETFIRIPPEGYVKGRLPNKRFSENNPARREDVKIKMRGPRPQRKGKNNLESKAIFLDGFVYESINIAIHATKNSRYLLTKWARSPNFKNCYFVEK